MNIFVLDNDPTIAATYQCDKHIVKMAVETAQLLCSPFPIGTAPYRRTHYNHPCAKWTRESKENFLWLIHHGMAICQEYTRRYHKQHKSYQAIMWCLDHHHMIDFPHTQFTQPPQCMPDECKDRSVVSAYRTYYKTHKKSFAVWKHSAQPWWWSDTI